MPALRGGPNSRSPSVSLESPAPAVAVADDTSVISTSKLRSLRVVACRVCVGGCWGGGRDGETTVALDWTYMTSENRFTPFLVAGPEFDGLAQRWATGQPLPARPARYKVTVNKNGDREAMSPEPRYTMKAGRGALRVGSCNCLKVLGHRGVGLQ